MDLIPHGFFWLVGEGMRHALHLDEAPPEQLGGGSVSSWTTLRLAYPLKPLRWCDIPLKEVGSRT